MPTKYGRSSRHLDQEWVVQEVPSQTCNGPEMAVIREERKTLKEKSVEVVHENDPLCQCEDERRAIREDNRQEQQLVVADRNRSRSRDVSREDLIDRDECRIHREVVRDISDIPSNVYPERRDCNRSQSRDVSREDLIDRDECRIHREVVRDISEIPSDVYPERRDYNRSHQDRIAPSRNVPDCPLPPSVRREIISIDEDRIAPPRGVPSSVHREVISVEENRIPPSRQASSKAPAQVIIREERYVRPSRDSAQGRGGYRDENWYDVDEEKDVKIKKRNRLGLLCC